MNCESCVCRMYNEEGFPHCSADPNWPAPCEYEDEYEDEKE